MAGQAAPCRQIDRSRGVAGNHSQYARLRGGQEFASQGHHQISAAHVPCIPVEIEIGLKACRRAHLSGRVRCCRIRIPQTSRKRIRREGFALIRGSPGPREALSPRNMRPRSVAQFFGRLLQSECEASNAVRRVPRTHHDADHGLMTAERIAALDASAIRKAGNVAKQRIVVALGVGFGNSAVHGC